MTTQAVEVPAADSIVESIDDILSVVDVEYKTIDGFAPGKKVRIASLSAGDLIEFNDSNKGAAQRGSFLRLVAKSLVNSKGERYASSTSERLDATVAALRMRAHKTTERIAKEVLSLNGIEIDADKLKKANDDAKNE